MESTRQQKIARLIQKDIGIIFQQESRNLFDGALITVTKVQVSKDLALTKIYLSLFGIPDKNVLLEKIRHHGREVRYLLVQRIHNQLRVMPDLQFFLDDSLDYIDNIDNLLHEA
ncbi:MAG: 30S ribosome-binding factor RbfA [Bacteroidales bacterium]|nr:30S ribosome-binding factor RbfA [Bacteroidales bacterium]MDD4603515.1 30S ribosome-binding factor RbfA [Bacteroidales bacterium]